ncbi:DUF1573 domain-containing protein [Rhodopirellula europaea]|uniref:DUF1573 domain-containing protein n=1 Tax=Rhodopirellula europaea TaxID=1263866 RepID=UPI003D2BBBD2|tara:strand:+ start:26340 stop:27395 length:1056 start_codon:yes stop_codon:yes gene_type:complete
MIRRHFILAVNAITFTTMIGCTEHVEPVALLRIEPSVCSLGDVRQEAEVDASLHLYNDSPQKISLIKLKPSCGCTTMLLGLPTTIESGQSIEIPIQLETGQYAGWKRDSITAVVQVGERTSPERKQYLLGALITANVIPDIQIGSGPLHIPTCRVGETTQTSSDVSSLPDTEYIVTEVTTEHPAVSAWLESPLLRGEGNQLTVSAAPRADASSAVLSGSVTLHLYNGRLDSISVPYRVVIVSPLDITPPSLVFAAGSQGTTYQREFAIRAEPGTTIRQVYASLPNLTLQATDPRSSETARWTCQWDGDLSSVSSEETIVSVEFENAAGQSFTRGVPVTFVGAQVSESSMSL